MKLSKSLLSAMAVGIAFSTSSCSLGDIEETHYDTCEVNCELEHSELNSEEVGSDFNWEDCPPCGMG